MLMVGLETQANLKALFFVFIDEEKDG